MTARSDGPVCRLGPAAHTCQMPDEEDRPRDAGGAADATWASVVVPDDISELDADVEAYRREIRALARRRRWQRRFGRPWVLPVSIVSAALILAGIVATMRTVFAPTASKRPVQLPLSST